MKFISAALLGIFSAPLFATSPIHPYTHSTQEIQAILADKDVQQKLYSYNSPVTGVTQEKLRHGKNGWVITTGKCALEVEIEYRKGKMDPRFSGGFHTTRHIQMHDCR